MTTLVQVRQCGQGFHIKGVCAHPGSKPDMAKRKRRNRAAGKVARKSRRANR